MDEDKKNKDNKLINTKIKRPQLIRRYTERKSHVSSSSKQKITTHSIANTKPKSTQTSNSIPDNDINSIGEINITLIDKSNNKSYMSYGSNNEIHIDSMIDNLIHTSLPAFTEYVIEITNLDPSVDVFYTLDEGRVNDRNIIIDPTNNQRIQCFDKFKLKGYRLQPKNPNGSAFLSYKNSDDSTISNSKYNKIKHNSQNMDHDFSHDNMIVLIFKKWLTIPVYISKDDIDENKDITDQETEVHEIQCDMKLLRTLMFKIKIDCANPNS